MKPPVIPKFEPEIVAAIAKRKYHGDSEKVATTSIKALDVHGVSLRSRYDKAHEYAEMAAMVEGVLPELGASSRAFGVIAKRTRAIRSGWRHAPRTKLEKLEGRSRPPALLTAGGTMAFPSKGRTVSALTSLHRGMNPEGVQNIYKYMIVGSVFGLAARRTASRSANWSGIAGSTAARSDPRSRERLNVDTCAYNNVLI